MSNFLHHLLKRSLVPAPTLQPRLASRFEAGPAPARFTEERIETSVVAPVAPAPSRPAASPAHPSAAPRAEISPPAASPLSVAVPPPAAPPPVIAALSAPLAGSRFSPVATLPQTALLTSPASFSAPPTAAARETFSLPPASASTLLVERVTERIRESSPVSGTGISSSATATASPMAAPAFTPATPRPIAAPPSPSAALAALPFVAPTAAPTIRVTIGRVDIRAIHAPPAAPVHVPAPARRPLVSLETYLNQRNAK